MPRRFWNGGGDAAAVAAGGPGAAAAVFFAGPPRGPPPLRPPRLAFPLPLLVLDVEVIPPTAGPEVEYAADAAAAAAAEVAGALPLPLLLLLLLALLPAGTGGHVKIASVGRGAADVAAGDVCVDPAAGTPVDAAASAEAAFAAVCGSLERERGGATLEMLVVLPELAPDGVEPTLLPPLAFALAEVAE